MNWDLTKLYQGFDDPRMEEDWKAVDASLEAARARLSEPMADDKAKARALKDLLGLLSEIGLRTSKLGGMTMLTLACDAENERAQACYDRLMKMDVQARQAMSAAARFVGGIEDLDGVIASDPAFQDLSYAIRLLRREAEHTIDPALEPTVLRMQLTGGRAWEKLRDLLDATHTVEVTLDGKLEKMPLSAARNLAYSPDASVRKAAYVAEIAAYERIETPMAACLNGIKGEALTMAELRHYDSVLDTALAAGHIDRQTLDAMLGAMKESLPVFRRYFRAKAKYLGYEGGLKFYDLFAPLGESTRVFTLEECRETLVRVLGGFSEEMGRMIERAFDERWIDAYPRKGKQGGAFCAGQYPLGISYVMTNFDGSLSAVGTLAHELGHAFHDQQLFQNSILQADAPMPLAETASIFNETLLARTLRKSAPREERVTLLDQELTDVSQVIVDILSRYLFESEVVDKRAERTLSARELKEIMIGAQKQTYGDGLDENALHPYMWACKSHYYSPDVHFYNFPYAFGQLFGAGVYALYEQRGSAFEADYRKLLRYTALADAYEVAKSVDIDLHDPAFWRASLKVYERACEEFVSIVNEERK